MTIGRYLIILGSGIAFGAMATALVSIVLDWLAV